jgi:putative colanic acid biosynthesis glycosyltransferase WcaI
MRLLIHDFAGHPFQAQLSRELAARGHRVAHVYAAGLSGFQGRLSIRSCDPAGLSMRGIQLSAQFSKYSALGRFGHHRKYAGDLKRMIQQMRPNAVLSGNTPIDIQAELLWECRKRGIAFIHWIQDIYCQALKFFLKRKLPLLAESVAPIFERLEKWVASQSDRTVAVASDFRDVLCRWKIPESRVTVIENWAPLDEFPQLPRENHWSGGQNLGGNPVLLYSGTLGMKHRPDLLYLLAKRIHQKCTVVIITDGIGREYLEKMPPLENLRLLPFQPYEVLPEVLASADVLLATLDAEAGRFAIPSKILSYLCTGRPILFAGPRENLSASIIERSGGGLVVDPDDPSAWVSAARRLISDAGLRAQLGSQARSYADRTFDIAKIGDAFENVLFSAYTPYANAPAASPPLVS